MVVVVIVVIIIIVDVVVAATIVVRAKSGGERSAQTVAVMSKDLARDKRLWTCYINKRWEGQM